MMRKTFIYIALGFKAVFLLGKLTCERVWDSITISRALLLRFIIIAFLILSTFNFDAFAQGQSRDHDPNDCEPGERYCRGDCRPARQCRPGVPPPPGLPIDSKLPYLLIAGLGLGIYFLKAKKPV